jgi:phosphatidylinositol alpha-1,6-mannosyltransferase
VSIDRPRILVVTRNFPPLVGGIERVMHRAVQVFAQRAEVAMIGPAGSEVHAPPGVGVHAVPAGMGSFVARGAIHALRRASAFRPDLVFAGSGLAAPLALAAARVARARATGYVYGLDLVVRNAVYQRAWLPAIRRLDAVLAISEPTRAEAVARGIRDERLTILHPGVDVRVGDAGRFRRAFGYEGRPLLLSLGRLNPRKGLVPFLEHAFPAIVGAVPDVRFAIIGADATEAGTHAESVSAGIRRVAAERGFGEHVQLLGRLDDDTVTDALAAADTFVFPVVPLPGDMEGFGMVAIEAAANGTPTLAFAVGGVVDAVSPTSGRTVASGDYAGMAAIAIEWLRDASARPSPESCRAAAEAFSWPRFDERLSRWLDGQLAATP